MAENRSKNLATVEQDSTSHPPIMTAGDITPEIVCRFELCCTAYFETKEIAEDKQVRKILSYFQDMRVQDWITVKWARFATLSFDAFMKELRGAYLEENWEDTTHRELGAMCQAAKESFWDFAIRIQVKNSMLVGTGSHLDEEKLCHRCESGMEELLAMRCAGERAHKKAGFKPWLNEVKQIDDLMWAERKQLKQMMKALREATRRPPFSKPAR